MKKNSDIIFIAYEGSPQILNRKLNGANKIAVPGLRADSPYS